MSINDGGPAFPVITTADTVTGGPWASSPGMTLRQWFAGMAMQAILANPASVKPSAAVVAAAAYAASDAMLAHEAMERGEKETTNAND